MADIITLRESKQVNLWSAESLNNDRMKNYNLNQRLAIAQSLIKHAKNVIGYGDKNPGVVETSIKKMVQVFGTSWGNYYLSEVAYFIDAGASGLLSDEKVFSVSFGEVSRWERLFYKKKQKEYSERNRMLKSEAEKKLEQKNEELKKAFDADKSFEKFKAEFLETGDLSGKVHWYEYMKSRGLLEDVIPDLDAKKEFWKKGKAKAISDSKYKLQSKVLSERLEGKAELEAMEKSDFYPTIIVESQKLIMLRWRDIELI